MVGCGTISNLMATPTPPPTSTPTLTHTPTPTSTPLPTNTPTPTSTPLPTNTPSPTSTPLPTLTPTTTPKPVTSGVWVENEKWKLVVRETYKTSEFVVEIFKITAPPGDVFVAVVADIINLKGKSDECASFLKIAISQELPVLVYTHDGKSITITQMNCIPSGQSAKHTFFFQLSEGELSGQQLTFQFDDLPQVLLNTK